MQPKPFLTTLIPDSRQNLFKELDEDNDGMVTFDELCDVVRKKLHKGPKQLSEDSLKALCTLAHV